MDINFSIQGVSNLNDYITATHDVKAINVKPTLNIATVLALKKNRSLEIEYLIKCDENGAACIVLERLLALRPSNSWAVLGVELMNLIKYWLEVVRKQLIYQYSRWWMFLKLILKFIKEIQRKDPSLPNQLVELVSECLLNLATSPNADVYQRHEILHCLNMVCAESGREVRFAMRPKFGVHFAKLAEDMLASSFFPFQYSALECLLRWLVPRDEPGLRVAAADKWLPSYLCPDAARNLFLQSNWHNFWADTRCFLNELNNANKQVISLVCKQLIFGKLVLIDGTDKKACWVDLDVPGKSVSVMLDPRALLALGLVEQRAYEALVIDHHITNYVILRRETPGLMLSFKLLRAPYIRPTEVKIEGEDHQVTIVISSRTDSRTLDLTMTNIFGEKYRPLINLDSDVPQSQIKNENHSEGDQPVEVKRQNRCGYAVKSARSKQSQVSPSSISTSSLNQLRDKLTALPKIQFNKEPASVCAQPALSHVSEVSEKDDQSINSATTVKFQPWGVRSFRQSIFNQTKTQERISRSDGESVTQKSRGGRRVLSPVVSEDNNASSRLVVTLGSNDLVANETIDQISKSKDFEGNNIVDLLMQQAFQAKPKNMEVSDSGINTDDKKSQEDSEAIENTPNEIKGTRSKVPFKKNFTVISKTTTDDESNTETIHEKPAPLSKKRKTSSQKKPKITQKNPKTKTVENIFVAEIMSEKTIVTKKTVKQKKDTKKMSTIVEQKEEDAFREDVNPKIDNDVVIIRSPEKKNETTPKKEAPSVKKKRKLYSPTDVHIDEDIVLSTANSAIFTVENKSDDVVHSESKTYNKTKTHKSSAACYKELEKDRKSYTHATRSRKSNASVNKMSTNLKRDLVDNNISVYDFTSSDDPDFVIKKIKLKPRTDAGTVSGIESNKTRKTRNTRRIKESESSYDEANTVRNEKRKKKVAKRNNNRKHDVTVPVVTLIDAKINPIDERIGEPVRTELNISDTRDGSSSPLPGLIVEESTPKYKGDIDDSLSSTMLQKFKRIYQECPKDKIDSVIPQSSTPDSIKSKSPVVSIARISLEEFNRWLPMPKTLEDKNRKEYKPHKAEPEKEASVLRLVCEKINLIDERMRKTVKEGLNTTIVMENPADLTPEDYAPVEPPRMEQIEDIESNDILLSKNNATTTNREREKTPDSIKSKSPTVSIARMSFEEFNKWLPMPNDSEGADGITIRSTKRDSKRINKDFSVHEDIDRDSNEEETTESPINVDSVESSLKSIVKISPVKISDTFACYSEYNDRSGNETLTRTKRNSFRPTAKSRKCVESICAESPVTMKRKSTSPLLSKTKKRKLDHTSHRDDTIPKRLDLDSSLVDSNKNTTESILTLLTEKLNEQGKEKEKQVESLKRLTGAASQMYKDIVVLSNKHADLNKTLRETIANFENSIATDIEFKENLVKEIAAMLRADCQQRHDHSRKENVQDIMEHNSRTDSS